MAISKRGKNKYFIRVYLGRDPITKKRLETNETFYGTYEEAEKREQILKNKVAEGNVVKSSRMNISQLLRRYLYSTRYNRSEETQDLLEDHTKRYIEPYIGNLQITKVKTSDIQNFFNFMLDPKKGKKDGERGKKR